MNKPVERWQSWADAPHVLVTREVLELFRIDKRTLANMVEDGLLARVKIDRVYRYTKPEVQRFAAAQGLDPFPETNPNQSKASH